MENGMMMNQGWVCPKCSRVYAPLTPMCFYCGNTETRIATHTDGPYTYTGTPPGQSWWKGDPTCGGLAENYVAKRDKE